MFTSVTPERQNLEVVPLQNEGSAHETAPIFSCFFEGKKKFPSLLKESGGHDSPFSFGM